METDEGYLIENLIVRGLQEKDNYIFKHHVPISNNNIGIENGFALLKYCLTTKWLRFDVERPFIRYFFYLKI